MGLRFIGYIALTQVTYPENGQSTASKKSALKLIRNGATKENVGDAASAQSSITAIDPLSQVCNIGFASLAPSVDNHTGLKASIADGPYSIS